MKTNCVAQLSGTTKRFGKIVALDQLDLEVQQGELLALLGPNGAGKSTAISLLLGLLQPDAGSARMFGQSPRSIAVRRRIGVMMQECFLPLELRVRELIDLTASYYPEPLPTSAVLEMTHTDALANRPYGKLSGGQKRQAQFAMAICGRPKLLFLDEPSVGLDVQAREVLWQTVRLLVRDGVSIVLTTHYLEEAEALANRVVVLAKGRLVAEGTVSEIRSLVVRKHISCVTTVPPEQVGAWPGVDGVAQDQGRMVITTNTAEAVVRRLMTVDDNLQELEVRRAGLAEAFTELTKEAA
ncbi:MAG TPA: ABC transporter ATP-binding protein [Bryobacteraceae bacterium]|nr:ABC transporter ATP-binding protein [Bryobacteraceae bacterium]